MLLIVQSVYKSGQFAELSKEIARLQTELHSARLQEFEAQEQVTHLTTQLDEERTLRQKCKKKKKMFKLHLNFISNLTMEFFN